jgi:hypothetical protein
LFSACAGGLLFPYFLGVTFELQHKGILKHDTPVAGASAGSLIAACCKSGLSHVSIAYLHMIVEHYTDESMLWMIVPAWRAAVYSMNRTSLTLWTPNS